MKKILPTHSWPIWVEYHRCPSCGKVVELRQRHIEEAVCPRCQLSFHPNEVYFGTK